MSEKVPTQVGAAKALGELWLHLSSELDAAQAEAKMRFAKVESDTKAWYRARDREKELTDAVARVEAAQLALEGPDAS